MVMTVVMVVTAAEQRVTQHQLSYVVR